MLKENREAAPERGESPGDTAQLGADLSRPPDPEQRSCLEEGEHPRCLLCGQHLVHLSFDAEGGDLKEKLKGFFISLKNQEFL